MTSVAPRELRPYQVDAANSVERDWADGIPRVGVVLPTGTGKSTVIAEIVNRAYQRNQRVVTLAHRGELLDQMRDSLLAVNPLINPEHIGIVRAEEDDHHCPLVFASLQTLATSHRRQALGHRDIILWDEVHHAGADGFHTTFSELGGYDHALMAGFTATMHRDGKAGTVGLGDVIEKISFERDIAWAIKQGYLVTPHGLTVKIKGLDVLDDVRNVAGDFHQGELAEVMEAATEYVVDAIQQHAENRRPIIFAASVDAAHHIAESLVDVGYPAEAVTGAMSYDERQPIYARYRSGETRALVTVQVLTEGADFPMCDTVVLARPTRSKNLFTQMVGRALRLYTDPWTEEVKTDALILDLAGSARNMRLVSLTQLLPGSVVTEVDEAGNMLCPKCGAMTGGGDCYACAELPPIDAGGGPDIPLVRTGPVDLTTVDLLAKSENLWMETVGRIPFIPLMEDHQVVFLMPEDYVMPPVGEAHTAKWAIGQIGLRSKRGGWVTGSGHYVSEEPDWVDFPTAMDSAEVWIVETDQALPRKDAGWRGRKPPSEKQIKFARGLGIPTADEMTRAQLSDEISVKLTSRVLDKFLEG